MVADTYHAGEIAVQERTGDRELAKRRSGMFGNLLGAAARAFLSRQGVAAVGGVDTKGNLWASLWCGLPGFMRCQEPGETIEVDLPSDRISAGDPVRPTVQVGAFLGMLAIDLVTRQRLRINGTVRQASSSGVALTVRESFGNCPKYIQRRERVEGLPLNRSAEVEHGQAFDSRRMELIARTDTLFVTSIHPARGLDASHRGGEPGFVTLEDARTLRIPDYPGNGLYQTLGNFEVDTRAGLALIDFGRRRVLSLTGNAVATFGSETPGHPTGGTGRYWSFTMENWVEFPLPSMTTWTLVERSPFNPRPGER